MQISVEQKGAKLRITGEGLEPFMVGNLFKRSFLSLPPFSSSEEFLAWFAKTQQQVGKSYALWLLSRQSYHSKKLERKLLSQGVSQSIAKEIVGEMERLGYIQDANYLEGLIKKEVRKGIGPYAILNKLKMKGIYPSNFDELIRKFYPEKAQKKALDEEVMRQKKLGVKKEKIIASMQRKGFSLDLIFSVVNDPSSWRN